jgi:hypothetical protein
MTVLFTYAPSTLMLLIVVSVIVFVLNCFFLQAALPLQEYRFTSRRVLEIAVIFLLVMPFTVFVTVNRAIAIDFVLFSVYDSARNVVSIACLIQCVYWWRRNVGAPLLLAASVLQLPLCDVAMPYNLLGSLALVLWRLWRLYPMVRHDLQNYITAYSIQEGIDALKTGVLFSHMNGEIVLVNESMLNYMDAILYHQYRNAHIFWSRLLTFPIHEGLFRELYEDKILFRLPTGESCLFARQILRNSGNEEIQITCTDVTEEDLLNKELDEKNAVLSGRMAQLRHILHNLEGIQIAQVYAEVTSRVHDLMGQRITIFQQLLRNKRFTDYQSIIPLVEGVMEDIRHDFHEPPSVVFDHIVQAYISLGIDIRIQGRLPEREEYAALYVEICREGLTNAVLHGNANVISIVMDEYTEKFVLTIRDNGLGCKALKPGQGLRGMKEKLEAVGGRLTIRTEPGFMIQAELGGKS